MPPKAAGTSSTSSSSGEEFIFDSSSVLRKYLSPLKLISNSNSRRPTIRFRHHTPQQSSLKDTRLPLYPIPSCRHCSSAPLSATSPNANGNAGRPYFFCATCNKKHALNPAAFTESNPGWMTWNDGIGVDLGNPLCNCGLWSRFERAGSESRIGSGKGFF